MRVKKELIAGFVILAGLALTVALLAPMPILAQGPVKQPFEWIVAKKLTVSGDAQFNGDVTMGSGADLTAKDLIATGDTTLGDAAGDTTTVNGDAVIAGYRDGTTGYDYFLNIDGDASGITNGAKTYGLQITMDRPADAVATGTDIDDAGLKIRTSNRAANTQFNTVQRGLDVQARNRGTGNQGTLSGAQLSIQTDSGGTTANAVGAEINTTINGTVTDTLAALNVRLFRQAATEPTDEDAMIVRSSSTSGNGADTAIQVLSDYGSSATTDSFDYGISFNGAAINTADIELENGETIDNATDGTIQLSGFFAMDVGATQDLGAGFTITPTASYQPITNSTGGSVTSDTSNAIADGGVAGTLLVVCNEDAQDMVLKDGANTKFSGDLTLTGGANDCITLLWNGTDWIALAFSDN